VSGGGWGGGALAKLNYSSLVVAMFQKPVSYYSTNQCLINMDKSLINGFLFLDLKKAFEGGYSYIRVLPDGFLLKAIVFTVCEHEYMNIHLPPPIIASSYGPAFDNVDHKILIFKLELYGIRGTTLHLFQSYLSERKQICNYFKI
jgi:hypothetical protein